MKMHKIFLFFLILTTGCASYQPGKYAYIISGDHPLDTPITAKLDKTLTTDHYALIYFNFGNATDHWLRVKKIRLDFNQEEANKKINIVVGKDLSTWAESIKHKVAVDSWNRDILLGPLALIGTISLAASTNSSNPALLYAGVGSLAVFSGISIANDFIDMMDDLGRAKLFPKTHLYTPFSVPAGLYTKRWILLQVKKQSIPDEVFFNVEYLDGKKAKYKIKI